MKITWSIFIFLFSTVNSYRILGWFNIPSISHQRVFQPIWKKMSLLGHEVTVITSDPLKDPNLVNLTEIDTKFAYAVWKDIDVTNLRRDVVTAFEAEYTFQRLHDKALEMVFKTEEVQEIMRKPKDYFDLILIEPLHPVLYGLQHKFDAPLITISSLGNPNFIHFLFGNSIHPSLYPDLLSGLYGRMTLWEKFDNLHLLVGSYIMNKMIIYPYTNDIARSYFGDDMPYIEDMVKKASLMFENVSPVFADRKPLAPNYMQFSIWNDGNTTPLPLYLQKILDDAKEGAIYFSLGTNVRFDHVQGNIKQAILEALGELPYTVLCKWESENFPGKPKNVILRKWFPQQAILAHPNVKVFITQGGLQSSEEAISNAVPLVVIPFTADQPMNAKILTKHGMAETISAKLLEKNILRDTILKVMGDEKYRARAQELRSIFFDQPMSGVDKVIWWCEYVIRHKGAQHLRSPSADIPLYEYFMLDVFAVIFTGLFVIYKIISLAVRSLVELLSDRKTKKVIKKKTN